VNDCRARFEESEGLGGFIARLWDGEHYSCGGKCQDTAVCVIGLQSSGRTRGGRLHGGMRRM
jgi:hypothetical protein